MAMVRRVRGILEEEMDANHLRSLLTATLAAEDPIMPLPMLFRTVSARIIIPSLYSPSYPKAASVIDLESGILLNSLEYTILIFHVFSGCWDDCIAVIVMMYRRSAPLPHLYQSCERGFSVLAAGEKIKKSVGIPATWMKHGCRSSPWSWFRGESKNRAVVGSLWVNRGGVED